jgi:hypothetical protein
VDGSIQLFNRGIQAGHHLRNHGQLVANPSPHSQKIQALFLVSLSLLYQWLFWYCLGNSDLHVFWRIERSSISWWINASHGFSRWIELRLGCDFSKMSRHPRCAFRLHVLAFLSSVTDCD